MRRRVAITVSVTTLVLALVGLMIVIPACDEERSKPEGTSLDSSDLFLRDARGRCIWLDLHIDTFGGSVAQSGNIDARIVDDSKCYAR